MIVTLHARVWIEMALVTTPNSGVPVTLHARVWIEIRDGLDGSNVIVVTLHARVWIEMRLRSNFIIRKLCHPPREGVD